MKKHIDNGFDEVTVVGYRPRSTPQDMRYGARKSPPPAYNYQDRASYQQPPMAMRPNNQYQGDFTDNLFQNPNARNPNNSSNQDGSFVGIRRAGKRSPTISRKMHQFGDSDINIGFLKDFQSGANSSFISASLPVLIVISQLRDGAEVRDFDVFRREICSYLQDFEDKSIKSGAQVNDAIAARYVLCSFIDESVMTSGGGETSNWSGNSLLNEFHGETWGGEKVFEILEQAKIAPSMHLDLLRLIDIVLLLGFEGEYGLESATRSTLENIREDLGVIISNFTKEKETELSKNWRGIDTSGKRLRKYIPVWAIFAITGVSLITFYSFQQFRLYSALEGVTRQLEHIGKIRRE